MSKNLYFSSVLKQYKTTMKQLKVKLKPLPRNMKKKNLMIDSIKHSFNRIHTKNLFPTIFTSLQTYEVMQVYVTGNK